MHAVFHKSDALWEKLSRDERGQLHFSWDTYREESKHLYGPGEHMFSEYSKWARSIKGSQSLTDTQRAYLNQFLIDYTADILTGA